MIRVFSDIHNHIQALLWLWLWLWFNHNPGRALTYIKDDDSVESAGSVPQRLVPVAVRVEIWSTCHLNRHPHAPKAWHSRRYNILTFSGAVGSSFAGRPPFSRRERIIPKIIFRISDQFFELSLTCWLIYKSLLALGMIDLNHEMYY